MRVFLLTIVIFSGLFLSTACTKEQDDQGYQAAKISYSTANGYVYKNDTFPAGDTIRIGVTVEQGTKHLKTLLVYRKYNGGTAQRRDSLPLNAMPFHYDTTYVLHDQPGTEQWTWTVVENNGDRTSRSLLFTTQ